MAKGQHETPLKLLPAVQPTKLEQALNLFILDCQSRPLTPGTIHYYRRHILNFINFLTGLGVQDLVSVSPSHIRAYLISLQNQNLVINTQHAAARAVKRFLYFCMEEGLIEDTPLRKGRVRMPKLNREILPAFSAEDVRKLLAACQTLRDRAMVLCLLDTGCRAAEFVGLSRADVDLTNGVIQVRQGKGRKDRTVFLGPKARKALFKYLMGREGEKSADPVWLSEKTGDRLTITGLQQFLKRLGRRAHVEHCHAHTFRRTFALWSLRAGMNLISLARIMGHEDLGMLRRYLKQVEEDLQEAHTEHGAVEKILGDKRRRGAQ